jgi:hypothetical protein
VQHDHVRAQVSRSGSCIANQERASSAVYGNAIAGEKRATSMS